jgi:hypothetical protein
LLDLNSGRPLRRFMIDPEVEKLNPSTSFNCVGVATDGGTAVALSSRTDRVGSAIDVWDLTTGRLLIHRALTNKEHSRSFSPDGKLMLGYLSPTETQKRDKPAAERPFVPTLVVLREVATGRQILAIPQPDSPGFQHAFSPDGQTLATVTYRWGRESDGYRMERHAIHLWELATGQERLTITNDEHGGRFIYEQIVFTPDGRMFATARNDHTIQLWDVATGQQWLRRTGYEAAVNALAFAPNGRTLASGHTDSTILLWDLAPESWPRQRTSRPLTAQELEAAWMQLANPDARKAHAAIWQLVAVPQQAVPLLRDRLHPAKAVPADHLGQVLKDLDSNQFREREATAKQLTDLEEQAEPALQDALKGNPSAEQRQRIEALLATPRVVRSPEKLRSLRALQVLEQCDLPEAGQVLKALAQGSPDARLTQEAKAVLQRLARRHAATP